MRHLAWHTLAAGLIKKQLPCEYGVIIMFGFKKKQDVEVLRVAVIDALKNRI